MRLPSSPHFPIRLARWLVGVVLIAALAPTAAAQGLPPASPAPDRSPDPSLDRDSVWVNFRPYPLSFWGPRTGPGIGAGLVVHNAGFPGSQILLTAAPTWHDQSATLTLSTTGRLDNAQRFGLIDARVRHTNRQWLYGIGPRSDVDTRATLEFTSGLIRLRYGEWLLNRRLLVQPSLRIEQTRFVGAIDVPASSASPLSQHLDGLAALPSTLTGVVPGLTVAFDTRDFSMAPTRGLLTRLSIERYLELDRTDLTFDRGSIEVAGWIPIHDKHRIALRGTAAFTEQRSGGLLPFYQLASLDGTTVPGLDRHRFVGNDRLTLSTLYLFPVYNLENIFSIEGHVGVHAASVYDDLADQFEPAVSFEGSIDAPSEGDGTVPLRPAASVGVYLGPRFRAAPHVELALGISPEGVSGVRFRFVQPLTPLHAPHHR